jgi:hypothetical protein
MYSFPIVFYIFFYHLMNLFSFFFLGFSQIKKGGRVLLSTRVGSRIGLQEMSKFLFSRNNRRETGAYILKNFIDFSRFKQPYPQTHWCPTPVEDQTNKPLCRPLPVDRMPPPARVEPQGNAWF